MVLLTMVSLSSTRHTGVARSNCNKILLPILCPILSLFLSLILSLILLLILLLILWLFLMLIHLPFLSLFLLLILWPICTLDSLDWAILLLVSAAHSPAEFACWICMINSLAGLACSITCWIHPLILSSIHLLNSPGEFACWICMLNSLAISLLDCLLELPTDSLVDSLADSPAGFARWICTLNSLAGLAHWIACWIHPLILSSIHLLNSLIRFPRWFICWISLIDYCADSPTVYLDSLADSFTGSSHCLLLDSLAAFTSWICFVDMLAKFTLCILLQDSLGALVHWICTSEFHTSPCHQMLSLLTIHFSLVANFKCILCILSLDVPSFRVWRLLFLNFVNRYFSPCMMNLRLCE